MGDMVADMVATADTEGMAVMGVTDGVASEDQQMHIIEAMGDMVVMVDMAVMEDIGDKDMVVEMKHHKNFITPKTDGFWLQIGYRQNCFQNSIKICSQA